METTDKRLVVLISGRGSNLGAIARAIAEGRLRARIAAVISNRADAAGLDVAREAGVPVEVLPSRDAPTREAYDQRLIDAIRGYTPRFVCLAGFMRMLGPAFCTAFPDAVLNIHPSLLPAFAGMDAQRQALEHGVRVSGATVHFVTPQLDNGPIVLQATVPVHEDDTVETLSARILVEEHRIYPEAIGRLLEGTWRIEGRRVLFAAQRHRR